MFARQKGMPVDDRADLVHGPRTGFERDVGFYSEYREATQGEDDV